MKTFPLLIILSFLPLIIGAQLPNGGFEAYSTTPDYWHARITTIDYHQIETHPDSVRTGSACARFHNPNAGSAACYYYGAYNQTGDTSAYIPVRTGEQYEFSFYYKTDVNFQGKGINAQILFANENDDFIGNVHTEYFVSANEWTKMTLTGTVVESVSKISVGIYYHGNGLAWIDDAELNLIAEPLVNNLGFEYDNAPQPPNGYPDYFAPRSSQLFCHDIELDFKETYLGSGAARFFNDMDEEIACYYYGAYDAAGTVREGIPVCPEDEFKLSAFTRVKDFNGNGTYISAIFFDDTGSYVARTNSTYNTTSSWVRQEKKFKVPAGAHTMIPAIEYRGRGGAWADHLVLERTNLVVNSSLESDEFSPFGVPDYWYPRTGGLAGIETDSSKVYPPGLQCGLFQNETSTTGRSYYYGPYDANGSQKEFIPVEPKDSFQFSAFTRCSNGFSGAGIQLSIIFWENGSFVTRTGTSWENDSIWTNQVLKLEVPQGVNQMSYSVEFKGIGKAWFDQVELIDLESKWYKREALIDGFETLDSVNSLPSPISSNNIIAKFNSLHSSMESIYNQSGQDGTWGTGYVDTCNNPLIRLSANAAIAYLSAYCVISDSTIFLERACAALDHLLDEQLSNGGYIWYNNCTGGSQSSGAVMYEGSIATIAMLKGYEVSADQQYLIAARKFCDYILNTSPSANANFTGFALWAMSEYLKVYNEDPNPTNNYDTYLCHALLYFDALHSFQLEGGLWSDLHNQYIWYHGIIARGLVNFQDALAASHPKYGAVQHATYKSLNHIIRSQRDGGKVIRYPYESAVTASGFPIDAMATAQQYHYPTDSKLDESVKLFTHGAYSFGFEGIQGHYFASLGQLIFHYYNSSNVCTADLCPAEPLPRRTAIGFAVYPNPADQSFYLSGEGVFKLYDSMGNLIQDNRKAGMIASDNLPSGIYFIQNENRETKRIIIMH